MVLNYCFYKIHQLLIIVNVNNKQKPFTHPTVNPFFNDYLSLYISENIIPQLMLNRNNFLILRRITKEIDN
jgi:hypothetical protein